MPKKGQRQCINPKCRRLIYDTEKVDELPDELECQHCHRINIIRRKKAVPVEQIAPEITEGETVEEIAAAYPELRP